MRMIIKTTLACVLVGVLFFAGACGNSGPRIEPIQSLSPTRTARPTATIEPTPEPPPVLPVNESGMTVAARFATKADFTRDEVEAGSFEEFLRNLPLKAPDSPALLYNGDERADADYDAVIDWTVTDKNEQVAGAIARIRAEYFYANEEYDSIVFTANDGLSLAFSEWSTGKTVKLSSGGKLQWGSGGSQGTGRSNFDAYFQMCMKWSGINSLIQKDLQAVPAEKPIAIGDIFAATGDMKYVIIVVDSQHDESGKQYVMLASGDNPAQQIRIWSNPLDSRSPWIEVDTISGRIDTGREGITLNIDARYRFK